MQKSTGIKINKTEKPEIKRKQLKNHYRGGRSGVIGTRFEKKKSPRYWKIFRWKILIFLPAEINVYFNCCLEAIWCSLWVRFPEAISGLNKILGWLVFVFKFVQLNICRRFVALACRTPFLVNFKTWSSLGIFLTSFIELKSRDK